MKPALIAVWLIIIGTGLTIILTKIGLERIKANYNGYKQAWLKRQLRNMITNKHAAEAAEKAVQQQKPRQACTCRIGGDDTQRGFCAVRDAEPELKQNTGWTGLNWRLRGWDMGLGPRMCSSPYSRQDTPNQPQKSPDPGNVVSLSWYRADK